MSTEKRVALVSGGARGIGRGIVEYLHGKGWRVAICDIDREAGEQLADSLGSGSELKFFAADVASEPAVRQLMEEVVRWAGRLDALVNNAGIASPDNGPVEELALDVWQRYLDVNLTGPFLMARYAVPHLRKVRGSIVNMASTRALQSEPDTEAYAATKGGLVALTHALAVSLGPDIRVNCISPGWIDVRELQGPVTAAVAPLSELDHNQHPAGRVGRAADIAAMVHYLIGEEAGFITGQNFVIDGGMVRKMIYAD